VKNKNNLLPQQKNWRKKTTIESLILEAKKKSAKFFWYCFFHFWFFSFLFFILLFSSLSSSKRRRRRKWRERKNVKNQFCWNLCLLVETFWEKKNSNFFFNHLSSLCFSFVSCFLFLVVFVLLCLADEQLPPNGHSLLLVIVCEGFFSFFLLLPPFISASPLVSSLWREQ